MARQPLDPARQSFCDGANYPRRRMLRGLPRPSSHCRTATAGHFVRSGRVFGKGSSGWPNDCSDSHVPDDPRKAFAHETRIPGPHPCRRHHASWRRLRPPRPSRPSRIAACCPAASARACRDSPRRTTRATGPGSTSTSAVRSPPPSSTTRARSSSCRCRPRIASRRCSPAKSTCCRATPPGPFRATPRSARTSPASPIMTARASW